MSSQPFVSSPFSPHARRKRRSKFTYKHLSTLAHSGTNCPLRVIAHIDLDAFYAQCESVRLGIDPSKPLAVQQWQGLIAINYPARAYGLNRHVPITEAKEKCPEIICQHVATWKEGDTKWSYSDDSDQAFKEIAIRKVSLDPYRIQSRKILALIKECLPKDLQKAEKASIDEVFLDLSAQVHSILLERYPELQGPAPYDDPSEPLPRPPTTALDWAADALVDLDSSHSEEDDPDWDDIVMLIASEIVRDVRKAIFDELHYTCSAGLSRNKMLAKLGSGHKKPNSQTVIRNRAVQHFLSSFKFTKIRNLGGKLGDEVVAAFNTDLVSDLLPVPLDKLKRQLGDDTGSWLHGVIRGEDQSEVNPRTAIKSMLSAKSFRPSINSFEVACKWLRIFVADIFSRLVEEGVLENKRRPKTINLHHRQGAQTRSKQAPIPMGKTITEDALYELAKNLLAQVIVDGRAWPCANLSLSVGGFEDGVTGNKGIGSFLVRGDEAKALRTSSLGREDSTGEGTEMPPPTKKRKTDTGITKFFGAPQNFGTAPEDVGRDAYVISNDSDLEDDAPDLEGEVEEGEIEIQDPTLPPPSAQPRPAPNPVPDEHRPPDQVLRQRSIELYHCERCSKDIPVEDQMEHEDFHFAQSLQNEQSSDFHPQPKPVPPAKTPSQPTKPRGRGRPPMSVGGSGGVEKGQRKLAFG
ncbi:DNA-directed DNA polymerase eta rad30 [Vermiconidia calcicola]|uniref:DNA-directed DNA polymerase eta rad30 n=1 Tax=Vermiconidia calcicola TaxID=1690605 RepID=A0ACC3NR26_9PEZI|nr:DNA-directed DNA polymerase eta rad30 [Vermiconidia calcicola]